ncbi:hypothetical protein NE237_018203 [Protea cynaroides]|uniref:Uncharacterized protein n=1 Tax=Protea cynaroides TaxID=273540 RepID=A0A9Q0K9I1_9MAGN|nr:hypothetical protein NE237_018203 [Protea cynaroides]
MSGDGCDLFFEACSSHSHQHGCMLETLCSLAPKNKFGINIRGTVPIIQFIENAQYFACNSMKEQAADVSSMAKGSEVQGGATNSEVQQSHQIDSDNQGSELSKNPSQNVNCLRGLHGEYESINTGANTSSRQNFTRTFSSPSFNTQPFIFSAQNTNQTDSCGSTLRFTTNPLYRPPVSVGQSLVLAKRARSSSSSSDPAVSN